MTDPIYLGDGVYAQQADGEYLVLTTGSDIVDVIYLDPDVRARVLLLLAAEAARHEGGEG